MTDTDTLTPTDADLLHEWDRVSHITNAGERRLSVMRAVLAKWGTPAPASQPVAAPVGMEPVYQIGQPFLLDPENTWRDASKDAYNVCLPNKRRIIYTASQVQAMLAATARNTASKPLTKEQK